MNISRENALNMSGRKIDRAERKAAILADMRELDTSTLISLKAKTLTTIEYLKATHATQQRNGLRMKADVLDRNLARPTLLLECLNEVIS